MVANEGFEVAFHGEFREIVPERAHRGTEIFEGPPGPDDRCDAPVVTTTFVETDGRTTMRDRPRRARTEVRDAIIESGMEGGMQEAMDKLEQVAISLG